MKKLILPVFALLAWGLAGCDETTPTATSDDLLPLAPRTIEVRLPWEAFASDLRVFGGFGTPFELGRGFLAHEFRGTLEARTLVRVHRMTQRASVVDSLGTTVTDSLLVFKAGRLVARFDTLATSAAGGSLTVSAHRILTDWHPPTASWTLAVDTTGDRRPWPVPGGGPSEEISTGTWSRGQGDSLVLPLDSATLVRLADTTALGRGVRLDLETSGARIDLQSLALRIEVVPSVRRDTVLTLTANTDTVTFIYTPTPGPPTNAIRVGGAPAWRTTLRTSVPRVLTGPPELCAAVGCPFKLTPENVSHASLVLQSRTVTPPGFEPLDTMHLDVRAVLAPERLPRAPLGESLFGAFQEFPLGRPVAPAVFREGGSARVGFPITDFVRAQVFELAEGEQAPPHTLAILTPFEPQSISFAEFVGPGQPGAPFLRLLLTVADSVKLP